MIQLGGFQSSVTVGTESIQFYEGNPIKSINNSLSTVTVLQCLRRTVDTDIGYGWL